ncbi:hypothetical protein GCM10009839_38950 [Catenulispora yoronensis]|uniref:TubC N-terminal docking domain-containing protein n=1 Tax=Catenulispora yoronensis TaxID=450799 RepID=A0ABP5FUU4_9ACTN
MPPVAELIDQARAAGVTISRGDDGRLRMRGPRRAAQIAQALRSREDEVLALLPPAHRCPCGAAVGVRLYHCGYRCPPHTPAALAGRPEADEYVPTPKPVSAPAQTSEAFPWPADETGRCATCQRPCHRYGNGGGPLCAGCRDADRACAPGEPLALGTPATANAVEGTAGSKPSGGHDGASFRARS